MRNSPELKNKFKSKLFDILSKKVRYSGKSGTRDCLEFPEYCCRVCKLGSGLAPPNIAPVAEAPICLYIIIFSGAILGGAKERGLSDRDRER